MVDIKRNYLREGNLGERTDRGYDPKETERLLADYPNVFYCNPRGMFEQLRAAAREIERLNKWHDKAVKELCDASEIEMKMRARLAETERERDIWERRAWEAASVGGAFPNWEPIARNVKSDYGTDKALAQGGEKENPHG